jgi:hypothetical protein
MLWGLAGIIGIQLFVVSLSSVFIGIWIPSIIAARSIMGSPHRHQVIRVLLGTFSFAFAFGFCVRHDVKDALTPLTREHE